MQNVGQVNHLLSICVQLANEAAKIIHSIQTGGLKNEQWKGKDDPMTIADVKAQTLIVNGIRKFYPTIRIVGEEEVEYEGDLGFDLAKLNPNLIEDSLFSGSTNKNTFAVDEVVVWVDPLDGTLSYVKEEYDAVTTLIGVSIANKPLMGVIGQPYRLKDSAFSFEPKIYFGHVDVPAVYSVLGAQINETDKPTIEQLSLSVEKGNRSLEELIGSTSKHRVKQETLDFFFNELKPKELVQTGGAGKKALLVVNQDVDYCVHFTGKASRWDTLAPEVLLNCLGGQLTSIQGNNYLYDANLSCYKNPQGGVYTLRKDVHTFLLDKMKERNIPE